jgi:hypothetical protein
MQPIPALRTPNSAGATLENVVVFFTRAAPAPDVIARLSAQVDVVARRHPQGTGYLHVIAPREGASLGDDAAAREGFTGIMRRAEPHGRGAAVVIERDGFLGAALRAMITTIVLAVRPKIPIKVFAAVEEAAAWLATTLANAGAPGPAAAELVAAVRELRTDVA